MPTIFGDADESDPIAESSGYATTFADPSDLEAYHRAIASGASEEQALEVGDNGIGHNDLGAVNTSSAYGVAVPHADLRQHFGDDPQAWRTARAAVDINGHRVIVPIIDVGPGQKAIQRGVVTDLSGPLASATASKGRDPVKVSLLANAGPDYVSDRQAWDAEQSRLSARFLGAGKAPEKTMFGDPVDAAAQTQTQAEPQQQGNELQKFGSEAWNQANKAASQAEAGAYQAELHSKPVPENDPFELAIKEAQVNPYLSDDQKAQEIAALREQQTKVKPQLEQKAAESGQEVKEFESRKPAGYAQTPGGKIADVIGDIAPVGIAAAGAGPLAPVAGGMAMANQAYDEAKDEVDRLHPEWPEEQKQSVIDRSWQIAMTSGIALGTIGLKLPIKNIVARVIAGTGLVGAVNAGVGAAAQAAQNVNMGRPMGEGVVEAGAEQGLLGTVLHGIHEIGAPREATERVSPIPRVETAPGAPQAPEGQTKTMFGDPVQVAGSGKAVDLTGMGSAISENLRKMLWDKVQRGDTTEAGQPSHVLLAAARERQAGRLNNIDEFNDFVDRLYAPAVHEPEEWVSAIANRFTEERSQAGEIGEIAPGEGYSKIDLRNRGLRMKPEEIAQHISDLMHNTGDPKLQAAAVTAEEARLSQRSSQLSRIAEDNPGNTQAKIDADNAFHDLTDFHNNPVAKLKNNWHAQGMTLQGEVPVDLSTFNGLREAWLRDVGKTPPKSVEPIMRRTAGRVRAAIDEENAAMGRLSQEMTRSPVEGKSPEEVRNRIIEQMKVEPCLR